MSIESAVSAACIVLGAMVIGVTLYRIVRGEPIGRWTYLLCALGGLLVVFPVTHTLELLGAGKEARDELGNLLDAAHGQPGQPATAVAPSIPTPAPGAVSQSERLASAVKAAEKATRAYDEVTPPIPVRAVKKIFRF